MTRALTATADSIPSLAQVYLWFLGGFYYLLFRVSNANITWQIYFHHTGELNKHALLYKPYASTEFTLNQYNEFAGGSIVFYSNPVCICALYRILKKKKIHSKIMKI